MSPSEDDEEEVEQERKTLGSFGNFLVWYFRNAFCAPQGALLVVKT